MRFAYATLHTFKVGDRVILIRNVDRFPDFVAPYGATGIVSADDDDGSLEVTMDEVISGAEEWNNAIHWFDDRIADIADDIAIRD